MNKLLTFVLPALFICLPSIAIAQRSHETAGIEKFITRQAADEHGEEYEGARKIVAGDLNHDGVSDLAVVYTIEGQDGTNNYIQYLAVFIRTKTGLVPVDHTFVGGKSNRDVDLQLIRRNVILLRRSRIAWTIHRARQARKARLASY